MPCRRKVELTDLLCADMKKEGLCGRTLTLKLKTASFEVRTRAVTLPEFICSSEDILKHASKLLRAELPVSLRLMGLRMSHFNEEKYGAPSDPAQKTISNFFKLGNASGKNTDVSNNLLSGEKESDLPIYNNEIFDDCKDPVAYSSMSDHNHVSCYSYQMEKPTDESKGKVNDRSMVGHTLKPCETGITRVLENDSCNLSGQFEESRLDRPKKENNLSDNEAAGYLPNQEVSFLWLDGYKCSLCGVELPPSFVEERQEHSDFHIAERLQEEESGDRNYLLKQRVSRKQKEVVGSSHGGRKKKHKSSPADAKHIPIDAFFVKSSQNI